MDLLESGFAVLCILFVSGYKVNLQESGVAVFLTSISQNASQDAAIVLMDTEWITGQIAGYSRQTYLLIILIGLCLDQVGFIIVLLYTLLIVSQLNVIIILIVK